MSSSVATKIETLQVPGANLYYEVRGSGPVLLMMPGGPADATAFRSIAGVTSPMKDNKPSASGSSKTTPNATVIVKSKERYLSTVKAPATDDGII